MADTYKYFFAVDLGATSGRTIVGSLKDDKILLEELTRFPNNLIEQGGHFYWDIYALYFEVIRGLKEVARRGLEITSIGIDTWGVDFVFIGEDGAILRNPRAYRDPITFDAMDDYLKHVISRREVYDVTGIQLMNFNSIFQLYAMRREQNSALAHAQKILFVPDALSWMLTGNEAYAYAVGVHNGWTFNLLISTVSIYNVYNGYLILPVLSAVTQIIMTKISTNQQAQQQQGTDAAASTNRFMTWFFPIFSLVICLGYSSAFALYWVTGNLVMMAQTVIFNYMLDKQDKQALIEGEGKVK